MRYYCLRDEVMICRATFSIDAKMHSLNCLVFHCGLLRCLEFIEYNPAFETPIVGEVFRTAAEGLADTRTELAAAKEASR